MQQHNQQLCYQGYALLPGDVYQSQVPIAFEEVTFSAMRDDNFTM